MDILATDHRHGARQAPMYLFGETEQRKQHEKGLDASQAVNAAWSGIIGVNLTNLHFTCAVKQNHVLDVPPLDIRFRCHQAELRVIGRSLSMSFSRTSSASVFRLSIPWTAQ